MGGARTATTPSGRSQSRLPAGWPMSSGHWMFSIRRTSQDRYELRLSVLDRRNEAILNLHGEDLLGGIEPAGSEPDLPGVTDPAGKFMSLVACSPMTRIVAQMHDRTQLRDEA